MKTSNKNEGFVAIIVGNFNGNGNGYGNGYGFGKGYGNGNGNGYGDGYVNGDGDGYGYGNGNGYGYGYGYGYGNSNRYTRGNGYGTGSGNGILFLELPEIEDRKTKISQCKEFNFFAKKEFKEFLAKNETSINHIFKNKLNKINKEII